MFKSICNNTGKYIWLGINASFISSASLNKKNKIFCSQTPNESNPINTTFKINSQYIFQTLNANQNKNLDPSNPNRKVDNTIRRIIGEYRAAALFEDYSDLFAFSDELISQKEKERLQDTVAWNNIPSVKKKKYEEESFVIGDDKVVPNRSYIQVDLDKVRNGEPKQKIEGEDEFFINDPERYFQKILIFRINDNLHATSSFCGYDLTDLKYGALLGNKLICPTCLSEYNIESGMAESGPNTRYLATFPVAVRKDQVVLKVPLGKIPLFSNGPVVDPNELDPRHFILIGDNETVYSCVDTLLKTYSGKISIVTNQCGNNFVDQNKLTKSFFPLKMRQAKFFPQGYLDYFKIQVYEEKIVQIDGIKRMVTLSSGNKLPFDKVLIAVGSNRKPVNRTQKNCYELNTIRDHAKIHNAIIKPEVNAIAMVGNTIRTMEIASSLRRYLDAIDRQNTKIYIITKEDNWFLERLGLDSALLDMMTQYLKRNRIFLFRGNKDIDYEENIEENKMSRVILMANKYAFKLPADVFIFDNPVIESNIDFINKIILKTTTEEDTFKKIFGNVIMPDERMSLHTGDKYAHVFTAGSCSAIYSNLIHGLIRTDNVKVNFHLGYIAALNMLEVHYPFDDVIVEQAKVLEKNLYFIGNDNLTRGWDKSITHYDSENERFVIYYFLKNQMTSVLIYGYNRLHIFIREAMKFGILPNLNYVMKNKDKAHLQITQEVIKQQESMSCFKHKALGQSFNINTNKYSVEDQSYTDDIMKRGVNAYKAYEERINSEIKKNLDRKEKEMEERNQQHTNNNTEG